MGRRALAVCCLLGFASSCIPEDPPPPAPGPPRVLMDFTGESGFYGAPFPSEHLRREDGSVDADDAPNPINTVIVRQIHQALRGTDGFGVSSPIHFRVGTPVQESGLPDRLSSLGDTAAIQLFVVDPGSPHRLERAPFDTYFQESSGPYGGDDLLTLLPTQGFPLRSDTLYAAVITDAVALADGRTLERSDAIDALAEGLPIEGLGEAARSAYQTAWDALPEAGLASERVVAMAVFRTGDPTRVMRRAIEASADVTLEPTSFVAHEVFDTYCVFETRVMMPNYQSGELPYLESGGNWILDESGAPIQQSTQEARVFVTVPRAVMPEAGFPTAMLIRTGAGGDRALVDRGVRDEDGEPFEAGSGPAREFSASGFAGVTIDGPHGGIRNVTMGDEQFLVFNIQNPSGLRDNLRQSALELSILARALDTLSFDASSCPGLSTPTGDGVVRFDTDRMALFGHSMGASIAPLAAAFEPRFRALILSGAGGSWIANVIYKERPLVVRPLAETLLRYTPTRRRLREDDPALGLLQWAGESADAAVYGRLLVAEPVVGEPRHVLMFQGIVDHYILPPIANALTLSLGADVAGAPLDVDSEELSPYLPAEAVIPMRGRSLLPLPVEGNVETSAGSVTVAVSQHVEDGVEDGHEIVFQTEAPKAQYRCFLRTFAAGLAPRVPDPSVVDPACGE